MICEAEAQAIVRRAYERGWIRPLTCNELYHRDKPIRDEQLARERMCMARLRAEREGADTSQFPPRIRKRPQRKKIHGVQ